MGSELICREQTNEFSVSVGSASPNLLRAIDDRHKPTQQALEKLLELFGLRIGLARVHKEGPGEAT